jgi:hypothetical protein
MDGTELAEVIQSGEQLCVFLLFPSPVRPERFDAFLRFTIKVNLAITNAYRDMKLNLQLLLIALQCLWMYDYLLTFGDEVLSPLSFRSGYQVLTVPQVQYAWHGRKTWSGFAPA